MEDGWYDLVSKAVFLNMMKHYVRGISLSAEQLVASQE
jgi:hypothetical protein